MDYGAQLSWVVDIWGKIRRQVESDVGAAQASDADYANARLSARTQLAIAYFNLRAADSLRRLLEQTLAAYRKTYVAIFQPSSSLNSTDMGAAGVS